MLSCDNDFYEDDEWFYYPPDDFSIYDRKLSAKCCSCNNIINYGDVGVTFSRGFNDEENDSEINIDDYFMCENCGEIYLNLRAIGFSHYLNTDIRKDLKDYHELTGFKKIDNSGRS